MSAPASLTKSTPYFAPDPLLHDLLAVSLTAINLLRPCYGPTGELNDFTPEYFNPAAQRMTGLPERPVGTARTLFPDIFTNGIFAFYRQVFETGEPANFQRYYQADGLDNYFYIAARRSGERLLVSFTDTADQARTPAENALRESQARERAARAEAEAQRQRFYEVLMALPALVATYHGPTHVYNFANGAYQRYFPNPALLGRSLREVLPETDAQGVLAVMDRVYQTGEASYQQELEVWLDFEGSGQPRQLFLNLLFHPLRDAQGRIDGLLDFSYDVTEQVLARRQVEQLNQQLEAARAEAERERAQLQALLTQAPVAIALFQGEDLRLGSVNPAMAAFWGSTPAQVLGQPLLGALPELQGQGFDDVLRQVLRTQQPLVTTEVPVILQREGRPVVTYYNSVYQPLYAADQQVLGVLAVAVEVTEQVEARRQVEQLNAELETRVQQRTQVAEQAQAEAERQRQRVTDLVTQAPAAMCVVGGPAFTYEAFNPLYAAMFGGRPQLGRPMGEVLPEVVNHPGFLAFRAVYAEGRTFHQQDVLVPLARPGDGVLEDHYFSYTQQPRYDSQGQIDGVFVFAVEVTDQVQARQQVQALNQALTTSNADLHQSNTQLTRTNVDLDTFVYTASHDLKAPITNIEGILAALRDTLPAEVQQEAVVDQLLGLLDNTVVRFVTTIDQLTDLSRLQRSYNEPAERLALVPVIAGVLADLAPVIDAAAAQVQVDVPAELHVSFASSSLRSIVYNLLSNAIKYRDPARPAHVWLRAESQPGVVVLSVRDNGLGLTKSQQGRLFGVFQRLHTHVPGTGVGLYMIKRLIENSGASISVASIPGVGSTFTVTFPN